MLTQLAASSLFFLTQFDNMKQMKSKTKRKKACLKIWFTPRGVFHQVQENDSHVSALRWLEKVVACVEGADSGEVASKPADSFGCVALKARNGKSAMLDFEVAKHAASKQAREVARLFASLNDAFCSASDESKQPTPTNLR